MKRKVVLIQADLELQVDREKLTDYVKKNFKSLYSIVFCSGINEKKSYKDIDEETINRVFDVNVKSAIIIIKKLLPILKKNAPNSSILFIGSLYTYIGGSEESLLYSSSKSAITGLSRTITKISDVRSNIIIPGYIDAPSLYSKRMVSDIEKKEKLVPQGRLGTTREVADLSCFILSEKATYITGQEIHINGGAYFG
jgi:3-oxoacyl-[acyl-carrier protein] reductase